jgi:hypothetical protein
MQAIELIGAGLLTLSCGSGVTATDEWESDAPDLNTLTEDVQIDDPPVSATAPPPGSVGPCSGLAAYTPFSLGVDNTSVTYTRPSGCPGWSGLEAQFTTSAQLNRRKLYTTIGFDYSGLSNPGPKCLASKVEYETYRLGLFNGIPIWLPTAQVSVTPFWTGSICYWHNYNGSTLSTPGVYTERIRARGIRYNGQVSNAVVGARLQSESIP